MQRRKSKKSHQLSQLMIKTKAIQEIRCMLKEIAHGQQLSLQECNQN